ncbi:hypothetical protein GRF29_28g1848489 [Pseudopithomyces chartarum]|uniref:NF-kappa-B inhibitor-like protein 1 n=1 Tax=Pseudopithomyces chartarum TaxID=1892770 RepID=A0AAN6M1H9_9PLEO|nr:hypothetical protein GRF29_28g1848489 [Pseudopithomyces chartarum]
MEEAAGAKREETDIYSKAKPSAFQFKSSKRSRRHKESEGSSKRRRTDDDNDDDDSDSRRSRRHAKRRSRHRDGHSRRNHHDDRHFAPKGDYSNPDHRYRESLFDGLNEPSSNVDSDALFRESIFDAMADDEGADYWERVYGQPIHIYPNTKPGPDGVLERMTDEEYADFVRSKMWEKSHQHIIEERAAREKVRQEQKDRNRRLEDETAKEEEEREKIRRQMEESLQRGAERKRAKERDAAWSTYLSKWDHLKTLQDPGDEHPREIIPWPVESSKAKHVEPKAIERFFTSSPAWREDALALLKAERVRWHPDKLQRRFGQYLDVDTTKLVTAVFQVVDRLWNESK